MAPRSNTTQVQLTLLSLSDWLLPLTRLSSHQWPPLASQHLRADCSTAHVLLTPHLYCLFNISTQPAPDISSSLATLPPHFLHILRILTCEQITSNPSSLQQEAVDTAAVTSGLRATHERSKFVLELTSHLVLIFFTTIAPNNDDGFALSMALPGVFEVLRTALALSTPAVSDTLAHIQPEVIMQLLLSQLKSSVVGASRSVAEPPAKQSTPCAAAPDTSGLNPPLDPLSSSSSVPTPACDVKCSALSSPAPDRVTPSIIPDRALSVRPAFVMPESRFVSLLLGRMDGETQLTSVSYSLLMLLSIWCGRPSSRRPTRSAASSCWSTTACRAASHS